MRVDGARDRGRGAAAAGAKVDKGVVGQRRVEVLDQKGCGEAGGGLGLEGRVGHPSAGEGILDTGAEEGWEPMTIVSIRVW